MRIFKGTETTLKLFIPNGCGIDNLSGLSVVLFTSDPHSAVLVKDVTLDGNILYTVINEATLSNMEDGVINYIIKNDDDTLSIERQSNYYLKTPINYTAVSIDPEPLRQLYLVNNGRYAVEPSEGYNGINRVEVDVDLPVEQIRMEGFNDGHAQGFSRGEEVGYANGYSDGNAQGYIVGKEDGAIEQKSKLESINITENGTYSREDGYNSITVEVPDLNGSYDEGYSDGFEEGLEEGVSNAGSVIAETARVLNVTENGVYTSQYTQDGDIVINSNQQITGVYDDGTNFYDTAELFCSYVQLDVIPTEETRIEFWYLPNMPHMGDGFHRILYSKNEQINFVFGGGGVNNTSIYLKFGNKSVDYIPTKSFGTEWLHIIVDRNGATVNDVEMPFDSQATFSKTEVDLCINGGSDIGAAGRVANGTYGMVKIGDTTYIPYEGGFLNTNTDVLQPIIQPNLGILEDGTPIIKATYLNGAVFDTGLKITEDSTIELWINKYEQGPLGYYLYSDLFSVRRDSRFWFVNTTSLYSAESYRNYFEHITISKAGGFVVEDDSTHTLSLDSINFSSGNETIKIRTDNPNFAYGLLKINGNIIVPSEDGFTNITTNAPLRRCEEWGGTFEYKDASYRYYSNDITIQREGTLIRSVNVNVVPKINVAKEGLKFGHSNFRGIPEWADFEGVTSMDYMFFSCDPLENVRYIDTSSVTNMNSCFYGCDSIKQIATLDTSNVTNMEGMCKDCGQLIEFPPLNTIRVTNMREMFRNCNSLKKVPALDARSVVQQSYGIFGNSTLNNLTDFGGLIGLKASMDGKYSFDKVPNLTYESCINILNGLYDFTGNGITPASNEGKLKVHSNFLTTVGDEISIGTAKGWTITA